MLSFMFLVNIRTNLITTEFALGFSAGPDDKESACNAGNPGLIPGSGRFARDVEKG